jgi:tripartite-type tricarboxylate transporter receptor subunit TctC
MQQPTNRRLRAKLAIALLFASAEGSHAQDLPRQLTMVVPFAAGGPSDVAGRIIAQGLSEVLGQSVVVENPAGAGDRGLAARVKVGAERLAVRDRQQRHARLEPVSLQAPALQHAH